MKSVVVSLIELRKSGALSTNTFLMTNEESYPRDGVTDSDPSHRQVLNAAKISLAVVRAFAKYNTGVWSMHDMSALQYRDILLHLGYSPQQQPPNNKEGSLMEPLDPLLSSGEDVSLQFISDFFDLGNPLPNLTNDPQNSLRPSSTDHLSSQQGRMCQQKVQMTAQVASFQNIFRADGFNKEWSLQRVDITLPGRTSSSFSNTTSFEQTLGDLIHFIFSGNDIRLTSTLRWQQAQSIGGNTEGRAAKMRSNAKETLFSALVGAGAIPISICRLLSDLLNCDASIEKEEKIDTLSISIQDTIQDLEHMCVYPQIYLFNPETAFYTTNLLFGQRLYGRKNELTQLLGITTRLESGSTSSGAECVLVNGVGGSGKSHFVNNVATFLSNIGWIVSSASCGRDMAHRSSATVLSLLDTLIKNIVAIYESEGKDAKESISNVLDSTTLLSLSVYLPSLRSISGVTDDKTSTNNRSEVSQIQLTFLLSRLMSAILSLNRRIVLFLDNFEHVDSSALALLNEMLTAVGRLPSGRRNFLFIGCYRDGIDESHPLTSQLVEFRHSQDICLTEMKLGKLTIDDVTDIIMTELRLPRRHVLGLANIVHKKTSGHALFVVQLLNSLVRDSVIAYSPMKRRFDWNSAEVLSLKTAESVATLIVSNLSSFTPGELASLRALSCFGMEVKLSVISLLQDTCPYGGLELYLPSLIEGGVVEMKDSLVTFAHDLIQQGVYNNIPLEERRRLHLHIGRTLAAKVSLDQHSMIGQLEEIDFYRLSFEPSKKSEPQALNAIIGIASNQVNRVDPTFIDRLDRIRFARWNMAAASKFSKGFNFGASAHYCRKGIDLLYDCLWGEETLDLCRALHEGVASALLFIGDVSDAQKYATALIDNLPFADSLCAQNIMLRSLERMGKYEEQVAKGVAVLRALNFDIPSEPSPSCMKDAIDKTSSIASKYTIEQITTMRKGQVDSRKQNLLLSLTSIITGAVKSSSPYLPLITCAVVNHSLQNGVHEQSALWFACLGYFKIALSRDFEGGRYWANATKEILQKSSATSIASNRARIFLYGFVESWYVSLRETGSNLLNVNKSAVAMGDVESAVKSMLFSLRCSFYGGENLTLLLKSHCELLRTMKRFKELAKFALIDVAMIESLVGTKSGAFDVFEGTIPTEKFILADAQAKQNIVSIELIQTRRFFSAFWFGEYQKASELYKTASSLPSSKLPKLWTIYRECYNAIVMFHMYSEGEGEEWLDEGMRGMATFEFWTSISKDVFKNKYLLLQAEYAVVSCEIKKAKEAFEASIESARDHGYTNELGLAFERYGTFLEAIVETTEALVCFKSAHVCYLQWGAFALAEHVWNKYNLGTCTECVHPLLISAGGAKHARES